MEEQNLNVILDRLSEQNFWERVTPTTSSSDIARLTNELLGHRDTLLFEETLDSSLQNLASFEALVKQFETLDRRNHETNGIEKSRYRDEYRNRAVYLILHGMKKKIEFYQSELQVASRIQRSLLPSAAPEVPGYEFYGECRSCWEVGGDFYHYYERSNSQVLFLIADVAGKGLPSSLIVSSLQAHITAEVENDVPLDVMVGNLDSFLIANTTPEKFVTLFIAQLDPVHHTLTYVNAGHNPPVLLRAGGDVASLTASGPVVGIFHGIKREVVTIPLQSQDTLILYTDGVTEAESPDEELFGEQRMLSTLQQHKTDGLQQATGALFDAIHAFSQGAPATDDVTIIMVRKN